jgi:phosphoglycolate phosphatase
VQDCIEPPEFQRSAHFLLLNYLARCADEKPQVVLNEEAQASSGCRWPRRWRRT